MAVNYTPEMVDLMKSRYSANPTRETVEELANELNIEIPKNILKEINKLDAI